MKIIALTIFLLMVANAKSTPTVVYSIPQLQANLANFTSQTLKPQVSAMVSSNVQQFNPVSVSAISYELAAATNTLNHYGLFTPLADWMDFSFANIQGLVAVPDYVSNFTTDSYISSQTDIALQEYYSATASIFSQAQSANSCLNLNTSMNAFTANVITNVTNIMSFMSNGFAGDTTNEINIMTSTYSNFHNNITACSKLRPLPLCSACMLSLLNNQGVDVVTYSQNLQYYISDLIDRFFRNLHEQMAYQAHVMTKASPGFINVC